MDAAPYPSGLAGPEGGFKTRETLVGFDTNKTVNTFVDVTSAGVGGSVRIQKTSSLVEARHRWADSLARISWRYGWIGSCNSGFYGRVVRIKATLIGWVSAKIRPCCQLRPIDVVAACLDGDVYSSESPRTNEVVPDTAVPVKPIDSSVTSRAVEGCIPVSNRRVDRKLKFLGYLAAHPVKVPVLGAEIAHELKFELTVVRRTPDTEKQVLLTAAAYINAKIRTSKEVHGDARYRDMRPQTKTSLQMHAMKMFFTPSPDEIAIHEFYNDSEIVRAMHWRSAQAAPPRG